MFEFLFTATFAQRLRVIFWFAVYSFAFPLLFSIAQLVISFRLSVNPATMNDIILSNTSIAVIGVVFATVWVESEAWIDERYLRNSKTSEEMTQPVFVVGRPSTTAEGSDIENPRLSSVSNYSSGQQSTFLSLGFGFAQHFYAHKVMKMPQSYFIFAPICTSTALLPVAME